MKTSSVIALSALVLALPLLAGCSSGGASGSGSGGSAGSGGGASSSAAAGAGSGSGSGSGKQCLLSADDANQDFGATVTMAETSGSCSYTGDGIAAFTIFTKHSSAAKYAADVQQLKDDVGSGVVPVSGIGDKAEGVLVPKDTLIALDGDMEVQVTGADYGNQNTAFVNSSAIANAIFAESLLGK